MPAVRSSQTDLGARTTLESWRAKRSAKPTTYSPQVLSHYSAIFVVVIHTVLEPRTQVGIWCLLHNTSMERALGTDVKRLCPSLTSDTVMMITQHVNTPPAPFRQSMLRRSPPGYHLVLCCNLRSRSGQKSERGRSEKACIVSVEDLV